MAQPLKKSPATSARSGGRSAARTTSARGRGPAGRSRRDPGRPRPGSGNRVVNTPHRRPPRRENNPNARILAPLALIIFAIACLMVITSNGGETPQKAATEATPTAPAKPAAGDGPKRSTYRVKAGDSFGVIAERTGVPVETLEELNPRIDSRSLQPGQKLKLRP